MKYPSTAWDKPDWAQAINVDTVALPAYSLCEVRGIDPGTTLTPTTGYYLVGRPSQDSQAGLFVVGPQDLGPGLAGQIHNTYPAAILYVETATPNVGDVWGSKAGRSQLYPNKTGFTIIGGQSTGLVVATPEVSPAAVLAIVTGQGTGALAASYTFTQVNDNGQGENTNVVTPDGLTSTLITLNNGSFRPSILAWEANGNVNVPPGAIVLLNPVEDLSLAGGWSSTTSYIPGNLTIYPNVPGQQRSFYVCLLNNTGVVPSSNSSVWTLIPTWPVYRFWYCCTVPQLPNPTYPVDAVTTGWNTFCLCSGNFNSAYDAILPAWNSGTSYVIGDKVCVCGITYTCILNHTNEEPPNATYWTAGATCSTAYAGVLLGTANNDTLALRLALLVTCPFDSGTTLSIGYADTVPAWDATCNYVFGQVVCSSGTLYTCIYPNINVAPPSACYWIAGGACSGSNTSYIISGFALDASNYTCLNSLCMTFPVNGPVYLEAMTSNDGSLTKGCVEIMLEALTASGCEPCNSATAGTSSTYCIPGNLALQTGIPCCNVLWFFVPQQIFVTISGSIDFGGTIPQLTPLNSATVKLTFNPSSSLIAPGDNEFRCVWDTGDSNTCTDTFGNHVSGPATLSLVYGINASGSCGTPYMYLQTLFVPLVQMDLSTICQSTYSGSLLNPNPVAGNLSLPSTSTQFAATVTVDNTWGVITPCCAPVPFVLTLAFTGASCPSNVTLTYDPTALNWPLYSDCPTNSQLTYCEGNGAWTGSGGGHTFQLYCAGPNPQNGNGPNIFSGNCPNADCPDWFLIVDGTYPPTASCQRGCNPFYVTFYDVPAFGCGCLLTISKTGLMMAKHTVAATSRVAKPRLSFDDLARKRSSCAELKAAGKPCNEFNQPNQGGEPKP